MLVFEDCGGQSVASWCTKNPPLAQRVDVAIKANELNECPVQRLLVFPCLAQVAKAIAEIHSQGVIHKDINANNVVFNESTGLLQLIDFGLSLFLTRHSPKVKNPNVLEGPAKPASTFHQLICFRSVGTLAYISPEQTGRMNRSLDWRSDL